MNVLVVDDQLNIIEGIRDGVSWEKIGVTGLFTARSASEAIQVISSCKMDLVVTDIEMPGMSGIELARWISAYSPETGIIFLTSHGDFDYAQTAVKLKCCDYILQPVNYLELQNAIQKALESVATEDERRKIYENGKRWENIRNEIETDAWQKIVCDETFSSPSAIQNVFQKIGYEVDWNQRYYLVLASLLTEKMALDKWQGKSGEDFLDSDIREILGRDLPLLRVIRSGRRERLCIFKECELLPYMQLWIGRKKHYYDIACYCSEPAVVYDLHKQYLQLKELDRQNMGAHSGVFQYKDQKEMQTTSLQVCEELFLENWKQELLNHEGGKVLEEIRSYVSRKQEEDGLTKRQLFVLQQMILNSIYSLYNWDEKRFFHLLEKPEIFNAYLSSASSAEEFYSFIEQLISSNEELLGQMTNEDDKEELVNQIKMYIYNNLDKKLDRQDIAGQFFMSKDYLTHIFKKYTGESIVSYINGQKLNKAKDLLKSTNIPINVIASSLGFADYTYFSRLFRKEFGLSAAEYRNQER